MDHAQTAQELHPPATGGRPGLLKRQWYLQMPAPLRACVPVTHGLHASCWRPRNQAVTYSCVHCCDPNRGPEGEYLQSGRETCVRHHFVAQE